MWATLLGSLHAGEILSLFAAQNRPKKGANEEGETTHSPAWTPPAACAPHQNTFAAQNSEKAQARIEKPAWTPPPRTALALVYLAIV